MQVYDLHITSFIMIYHNVADFWDIFMFVIYEVIPLWGMIFS